MLAIKLKATESRNNDSATIDLYVRVKGDGDSTNKIFKSQGELRTGYVVGEKPVFPRGRPPHLSVRPTGNNSFKMKYYYYGMPGFFYPRYNREFSDEDILPFLVNNSVSELQINGSPADPGEIVYRPIWPKTAPVLSKGDTITMPK